MSKSDVVDGFSLPKTCSIPEDICSGCAFGKMQGKSFTIGRTRATYVGQLIDSDICGPIQIPSLTGAKYFLLFSDDCCCWRQVYFLQQNQRLRQVQNIRYSTTQQDRQLCKYIANRQRRRVWKFYFSWMAIKKRNNTRNQRFSLSGAKWSIVRTCKPHSCRNRTEPHSRQRSSDEILCRGSGMC